MQRLISRTLESRSGGARIAVPGTLGEERTHKVATLLQNPKHNQIHKELFYETKKIDLKILSLVVQRHIQELT